MKKLIRKFLNKRGFEIVKQEYMGDKFPNLSADKDIYYCETPAGKYYLPIEGLEQDAVANTLVRGAVFEPEIINLSKEYIRPGTAVLDIGANFGQMSITFSKLVGESGKVYSFEAQNFVFNFLKKNIAANGCDNIVLIEGAVYNADNETLYFPEPDMNSPAPYSGNSLQGDDKKGTGVKTLTIDSLGIKEPVSFMKVDIEGADIFALQGAKETIMKNRMPVVFEYTQHMQGIFGTTLNDYIKFAQSVNYRFEKVILGINYLILPDEYK